MSNAGKYAFSIIWIGFTFYYLLFRSHLNPICANFLAGICLGMGIAAVVLAIDFREKARGMHEC